MAGCPPPEDPRIAALIALGPDVLRELYAMVAAAIAAVEAAERRGLALTASLVEDEGFTLVLSPVVEGAP